MKDSNAINAKNKHSKDAQNANQYGTAQESARLQTGQPTNQNANSDQNNCNRCNKNQNRHKNRRQQSSQHWWMNWIDVNITAYIWIFNNV